MSDDPKPADSPVDRGSFPETRWSLVIKARGQGEVAENALEELCQLYWYPLYAFVRRSGKSPHDAEDLTQGFFSRVLANEKFGDADSSKGHLRSYMLTGLKHYMHNDWQKGQTQKRGGGVAPISIDQQLAEDRYQYEPVDELSPDRMYDRRWALTILGQVIVRLRSNFDARGKAEQFEVLKPHLEWGSDDTGYAEAAKSIGVTENNFKQLVYRLRRSYQAYLREEVAQTVSDPTEVDDELRGLLHALRGGPTTN